MTGEQNSVYSGTVIVIPTRNRSDLAIRALRSVLGQQLPEVKVMVSDNSTATRDRVALSSYCSDLAEPGVRYATPPASLSVTAHWEWAIEEALKFYSASHFIYLTDRMMFKDGALSQVLDLARLYPDKIISYNHDRIVDDVRPIRLERYPGTGKLLQVETVRLSYLFSQAVFSHSLPRMLNCIVPRGVLERMRRRFGNIFASIAPDFNFCFRCLDMEDSILFYDRSPIFHHSLDRSNGANISRGERNPEYLDFVANLPVDSVVNYATPIPEYISTANFAFHEYFIMKQETQSQRFFEVDREKYLRQLANDLGAITDPEVKTRMQSILMAHGMSPAKTGWNKLSAIANRASGLPLRFFGVLGLAGPASDDHRTHFDNLEDAIGSMRKYPRERSVTRSQNQAVLQARTLAGPFPST